LTLRFAQYGLEKRRVVESEPQIAFALRPFQAAFEHGFGAGIRDEIGVAVARNF
jgi:hypothetical protein